MNILHTLTVGLALGLTAGVHAQIAFTGNYEENFDSLGPAGTSLMAGWYGVNAATSPGAALTLGVTAGTATAGGLYNVGLAGETDRALGSLATGTVLPRFGAQFRNGAGSPFSTIEFSGTMEQWRSGSSATANESLLFEYSFNALGVDDASATWLPLPGLNLAEQLTATTSAAAVNGNLPENQLLVSGIISDANWLNDGILTIRWNDANDTGSDGLYALDNFRMSGAAAVPEPSVSAAACLGLLMLLGYARRR
jgi:hypothetical protein